MRKVMAGGTFSIIHPGHVLFLEKARSLGDFLVVVVASDSTVLRNKGSLLATAEDRKRMLEGVRFVDRAVIGEEDDFFRVVEKERPDTIALGYDQARERQWILRGLRKSGLRPRIVTIQRFGKYSTSGMLKNTRKERDARIRPHHQNPLRRPTTRFPRPGTRLRA
jgi:FAD synthetase